MYECVCGKKFERREIIREHIRKCEQTRSVYLECDICMVETIVFLQYGVKKICPTCAIRFDEENTKLFYGAILLNHMGNKYESILNKKIKNIINFYNIKNLSEIGIDVIVITYFESISPYANSMSKRGELVFIISILKELKRREEKIFEYVIYHEVMHAYLNYLNLDVTRNFPSLRSWVESNVTSTVEDIQVTKYNLNQGFKPYLRDEIRRDFYYYGNMSVPTKTTLDKLNERQMFTSMLSLSYSYATELFFSKMSVDSHLEKHIKRNLKLMTPHVDLFKCDEIVDAIINTYREKISETEDEKIKMFNYMLNTCDNWLDQNKFEVY